MLAGPKIRDTGGKEIQFSRMVLLQVEGTLGVGKGGTERII